VSTITLYHGTDVDGARDLLTTGVLASSAARYNVSGEFWASTSSMVADFFAASNPAGGPPARFEFEVDETVLQDLIARQLVICHLQPDWTDYEFLPGCFGTLNSQMGNKRVVILP